MTAYLVAGTQVQYARGYRVYTCIGYTAMMSRHRLYDDYRKTLLNPFPGAPDYCRVGGYVLSKNHCTRSEQVMIYLSVALDRG